MLFKQEQHLKIQDRKGQLIMSFNSFNSLLDKAISVANVAGKKTEEVVETSKLKLQEVALNADLEDCYEKIGSLVFRSRTAGVDNEEQIAELVAQAQELIGQLTEIKLKRAEIKKVKKCPNCGASCEMDSHFCSRCGMVLSEEQPVEPEHPEAEPQAQEEPQEQTSEPEEPQAQEQPKEPKQPEQEEKPLIEQTL